MNQNLIVTYHNKHRKERNKETNLELSLLINFHDWFSNYIQGQNSKLFQTTNRIKLQC